MEIEACPLADRWIRSPSCCGVTPAQFGKHAALRHKDLGIWQTWTWEQVLDIVRAYAVGLQRLGLKQGDTIAIVGANRPKLYWTVMAAQMVRAIPVPVYSDAVADELSYVLGHADVKFVAAQDQEQVDKVLSVQERVPASAEDCLRRVARPARLRPQPADQDRGRDRRRTRGARLRQRPRCEDWTR